MGQLDKGKYGVSYAFVQLVFLDHHRVISVDPEYSDD